MAAALFVFTRMIHTNPLINKLLLQQITPLPLQQSPMYGRLNSMTLCLFWIFQQQIKFKLFHKGSNIL